MAYLFPRRLRDKFWPEPLPPPGSFQGQTVLVTGATAGLGRAAAVHFATLGARVILTSRSMASGEAAKRDIERMAGITGQGKIRVMELDMNRYSSCVSFFNQLKQSEQWSHGLDCAVLNAGIINPHFAESPEGWEQTIQVNTLSTTLLGLLLLSWMKQGPKDRNPPHLVFVTSRDHLEPDITSWADWSGQGGGLLQYFSREENWPSHQPQPNYAESKLMLMYAVGEICNQAVGPDGRVRVIVNSVCPGLVSTDIARLVVKHSRAMQLLVPLYLGVLGKSADYGARFYVTAARASEKEHGKFVQSLLTDEEYHRLRVPNMESDTATDVKGLVWKEILSELREKVPSLDELMKA
ncbi:putative short chain dehydrogenase/ reductase [Aspergillus ibericus CBS 121593]|uniref:Putative short chain dehydrogenase/ reductase n=1 Tax=Aspergillus ibericus CBS 121593 TaxID=1448316 RepID=A0A395HDP9_9EURO|nr:putative short chain dehydrogenase/ reductase [Aspergillus ibericus CBS 121593]RAL05972.1 putative short chain dehydrogenase/ reductase [Aspergillus ibericus CBS 121593]